MKAQGALSGRLQGWSERPRGTAASAVGSGELSKTHEDSDTAEPRQLATGNRRAIDGRGVGQATGAV